MIIALTIVILFACIFAFLEEDMGKSKWPIYIGVGVLLIILTAIRPLGMDNDAENYEQYFLHYDDPLYETVVEFSYRWAAKWLYMWFGDVHSIFLLYALIGISIKFAAFRQLTPVVFLAVVVYMGNYFILHEFTQIRAGVASSIMLLTIKPLGDGRHRKAFGLMLAAIFFHYSSLLMLPLLLLTNHEMTARQRFLWALLVPAGYLACFMQVSIASLPIPYVGDKVEMYQDLKDQGFFDEINIFNMVFLVNIAIYLYLLYMYDIIKEHSPYLSIMLKMMGLSVFCFVALSSLPVLAFRVSELYGIVEIVLFTNIYYTIRPAWLSKSVVMAIGVVLFCINVFYNEILQIM